MKKLLPILAGAMMLSGSSLQANMQEIAFYVVKPASRPLVIDGQMSDSLWDLADAHTNYYVYFKADPDPSPLKTEFRMLYDARGVYLGIKNYDDNIAGIRKTITEHGSVDVWTDDCAELYFGGIGHGGGFRSFKSNVLGATHEMNRLDTAVVVGEWQGTGWFVKTSIQKDHWILEGFFPWEDIGRIYDAGEILRFCHTRYAYSSGKFVGATSSPGGNYSSTHNFGYLYLARQGQSIKPKEVARILADSATPPWGLDIGGNLIADTGDGPRIEPMVKAVASAKARLAELDLHAVAEAETLQRAETRDKQAALHAATTEQLTRPDETSFTALRELRHQADLVEDLWIGMKLEKEFN